MKCWEIYEQEVQNWPEPEGMRLNSDNARRLLGAYAEAFKVRVPVLTARRLPEASYYACISGEWPDVFEVRFRDFLVLGVLLHLMAHHLDWTLNRKEPTTHGNSYRHCHGRVRAWTQGYTAKQQSGG